VERTSRFVVLGHLGRERNSNAVKDSLVTVLADLPESVCKTMTWDQGPEMSEHQAFTMATDMAVYFADPGSPWQRGTNENTNGLLRQYLPRAQDLSNKSPGDLQQIADELNSRPRKVLDWDTPSERLNALMGP
jgi:IS30 family transposase